MFITFFGYIDGVQRWMISDTIPIDDVALNQPFAVPMLIGENGQLNAPQPGDSLGQFGELQVNFTTCETASMQLVGQGTFAGVGQAYSLDRLAPNVGTDCFDGE